MDAAVHHAANAHAAVNRHAGAVVLKCSLLPGKRGLDELRATWKELTPGHAGRHNLDNAARIERELQGRLAANDLQPTSAPCNGYWDYAEGRRERSPLLGGRELAFPQKVR